MNPTSIVCCSFPPFHYSITSFDSDGEAFYLPGEIHVQNSGKQKLTWEKLNSQDGILLPYYF